MEFNDLKLDLDAAEDGTWFPFGPDAEVKIARWHNEEHRKFIRRVYSKHGKRIDTGAMSDDEANRLMLDQWRYIIRDWKGFTLDGEELTYSPECVRDLAGNPQFEPFFNKVQSLAKEEENFRVSNMEDLGEDSPTA